ncbi:hypothetical protein ATE92_2477 [Ulvibacter sp. MAR_2010_11]|uniref:DUF6252 family protein n=1 Tax=Ulvibacter sp. MAR_2010_11 TaxID=1250229 RepID=UPI000C2CD4EA|nr:DUF6252 family protein [Ulvibacter sp. MAR_2010_11]PKA84296.1 hypothetical protein ATE92_2477 [Ulvibacter sp. MAR_2010_11]
MKKFQLLNWVLVAFLTFQFISCDNEPLEGDFQQDETNTAGEGEFIAKVNGQDFLAETASGVLSGGVLVITGLKSENGENITLSVAQAGEGMFNLVAGVGTQTFGMYFNSESQSNPYISYAALSGHGQLTISEMDTEALTVTGTFNFVGGRFALDGEGNPVLDGSGNPVIETIEISNGAFNTIEYTIEDNGGGNVDDAFFAKVDGVDFIAQTIEVTQSTVAGIPMLKLVATNAAGAYIRIDFPEGQGYGGPFDMQSISNGTDLIAMYNAGTGGEDLSSSPGVIEFLEFGTTTGKVRAQFNFTATDPLGNDPTIVQITQGSFAIDYIENTTEISDILEAEVDGVTYTAATIELTQTPVGGIPTVWVTTEDTANMQFLRLTFPETIEVGSYAITSDLVVGDEKIALFIPNTADPHNFKSDSGILTIISYDTFNGIIEGTFEFTAIDMTGQDPTIYQIANGTFTIQIDL